MRSLLLKRCVGSDAKVPRDGRGNEGREGRGGVTRLAEGTGEDEGASRLTAADSAGYTLLPQRLFRGSSLPPSAPSPPCSLLYPPLLPSLYLVCTKSVPDRGLYRVYTQSDQVEARYRLGAE
jgi:hypothetical protein